MEEGKPYETCDYEENSSDELASYRAMYARFTEIELERKTRGPYMLTGPGITPKQEADLTRRSLLMRSLKLATELA